MTASPLTGPWLVRPRPNPSARIRLLCVPFAGGGPSLFRRWPDGLPVTVEVVAVQLPGRESRLREPPFQRIGPLVGALAGAISAELEAPFALFGHSMGALVGFELTRELRRRGGRGPTHLFVSGRGAPQRALRKAPVHNLPDAEFRQELRKLEGTPRVVLEHEELMELFSPMLRADFAVNERYQYEDEPPLNCPITALGGLDDSSVSRDDLDGWREQTSANFKIHWLPGNHFFLQTAEPLLLSLLGRTFRDAIRSH